MIETNLKLFPIYLYLHKRKCTDVEQPTSLPKKCTNVQSPDRYSIDGDMTYRSAGVMRTPCNYSNVKVTAEDVTFFVSEVEGIAKSPKLCNYITLSMASTSVDIIQSNKENSGDNSQGTKPDSSKAVSEVGEIFIACAILLHFSSTMNVLETLNAF